MELVCLSSIDDNAFIACKHLTTAGTTAVGGLAHGVYIVRIGNTTKKVLVE